MGHHYVIVSSLKAKQNNGKLYYLTLTPGTIVVVASTELQNENPSLRSQD
jgi:hypothetical protein